mmetsp:Transcript_15729/g.50438  ORF Transcript_15729/g.50438 Transcript_15729/m.50438 type:complete len:277 (-) Transcript_15729:270-1100(-)
MRSLSNVHDAAGRELEGGFAKGMLARLFDAGSALFAAALAQVEANIDQVGENVSANSLLGVVREGGPGIRAHLVCQDNCDVEFLRHPLHCVEDLGELLLPRRQLASSLVLVPQHTHDGVDDDERHLPLGDHPLGLLEGRLEVVLVVDVVHEDVLVGQIAIHAEPVGNLCESLVRKGVLRVQVEDRTVAAALLLRHEAGHRERHRELRLSGAELAHDLRDDARLDAALEKVVQLRAPGRDVEDVRLPLLPHRAGRLEAQPSADLPGAFLRLEHLGLG